MDTTEQIAKGHIKFSFPLKWRVNTTTVDYWLNTKWERGLVKRPRLSTCGCTVQSKRNHAIMLINIMDIPRIRFHCDYRSAFRFHCDYRSAFRFYCDYLHSSFTVTTIHDHNEYLHFSFTVTSYIPVWQRLPTFHFHRDYILVLQSLPTFQFYSDYIFSLTLGTQTFIFWIFRFKGLKAQTFPQVANLSPPWCHHLSMWARLFIFNHEATLFEHRVTIPSLLSPMVIGLCW